MTQTQTFESSATDDLRQDRHLSLGVATIGFVVSLILTSTVMMLLSQA